MCIDIAIKKMNMIVKKQAVQKPRKHGGIGSW